MVKDLQADYEADIREILSHRKIWRGSLDPPDKKPKRRAVYHAGGVLYLRELGVPADDPVLEDAASLIFSTWKEDGRSKISPNGGIYPLPDGALAVALCHMGYAGRGCRRHSGIS